MNDILSRYYFPELGIRAAFVRLHRSQAEILQRAELHDERVANWLMQFATANALMISGIKFDGRLVLQLQSNSAIRLLFSDCTSGGHLRGIVRMDGPLSADISFANACQGGYLAITIEPKPGQGERYQGIVPIDADGIVATLEHYFEQSEQLPTRFFLAANSTHAAGIMVQSVANSGGSAQHDFDPDGWNRVNHLCQTIRPDELLALAPNQLMLRLFAEETVHELGEQALRFHCPCSRQRVAQVLISIGHDEALAAASDGFAQIHCEFCGNRYQFDRVEIESLFQADRLLVNQQTQLQ